MNDKVDNPEFEMKHRLLGAAILISLGVLILPWLLGSYSVNADGTIKDGTVDDSVGVALLGDGTQAVSDPVSDNSIQIPDDAEIKVFVSKIKPVDSSGRKVDEPKTAAPQKTKAPSVEKVVVDKVAVDKAVTDKTTKKVVKKASDKKTNAAQSAVVKKTDAKKTAQAAKTETNEKPQIKQGYIVSVGVYLKRAGADSVMQDLRSKGFEPSSSKINTSKGVATRVWLGPYSTRAKAGKERSKLERIVGEPGLIKSYP